MSSALSLANPSPVGNTQSRPSVRPMIRGPVRAGLAIVAVFFGVFGGWAATAPLSSGALAPGLVSPDSSRKVIQHFEGGIIQAIHVREGERVVSGQPLITLEPTRAEASFTSARDQWLRLLVTRARLDAAILGQNTFALPADLEGNDDASIAAFKDGQLRLLETQMRSQEQQIEIAGRQIEQLQSQIVGLEAAVDGQQTQLRLTEQDLADSQKLLEGQLVARRQVSALEREQAELQISVATNRAAIAAARQSIEEVRLALLRTQEDFRIQIERETGEVNNQLAVIEQDLASRGDVLRRTEITSPVDGVVINLRQNTTGGVVTPGDPIMEVVPADDDLIVVAKLAPRDIDAVSVGLKANIVLSPFASRNALPLVGEVTQVAADTTFDEVTRQHYFALRIRVPAEELAKHEGMYMSPGMPADVTVVTGARTMMQYLAEPLLKSLRTAFVYD